ncbi:Putative polymerase [Photobacterium marinum]|uniref:Putative polymerase n=1 Tax=Photobacterium marinum TaxID=1056511 RepID=L8JCG8_9GAMM|nr:FapA family protein [Photobacterium marinum]ELR66540.1 Putative polymerase [Photobacterium marinum]
MTQRLLKLSQDGQTISLQVANLPAEAELTRDDIVTQLAELDALDFYLYENAIDTVLQSPLSKKNETEPDDDSADIVIAERRDAALVVKTDPDLMAASITAIGAYGGSVPNGNLLINALKENGIVKGIRKSQLQELLHQAVNLAPGQKFTLPVAFGRQPEHGRDAVFEPLVEDASRRILRPQEGNDGKVDMRDLGELITVRAGQAIMRKHSATEGVPGFNVLGKAMAAIPGNDASYNVGEGTELCENDYSLLMATKSGLPVVVQNGMTVDDALTLNGVNVSTGHINFDGSILINGDVSPGMKVFATGNITVNGFVELAELRAGGDIAVVKGIIGRQQEGNKLGCYVQASGKVTSKFAQFVEIEAGKDVCFSLHALHCVIKTQGGVQVIDEFSRHGTLSGGYIEADYGVRALNIGALAGIQTEIVAFSHYTSLREQLNDAYRAVEQQHAQLQKIKEAQLKLLKIPTAKRPPELIEKIKTTTVASQQKMLTLKTSYLTLKQEYQTMLDQISITAVNRLYSGVSCQIERERLNIQQEHGPSTLLYKERALQRLSL